MRIVLRTLIPVCVCLLASIGTAHAGTRVLGQLGQALDSTRIYSSPTSNGHVYYRVHAFEYLVVKNGPKPTWLQVLLNNGRYGYVKSEVVAKLPYQVTAQESARPRSDGPSFPASRSGSAVADYAMNFVGTPYKWGGEDVQKGIDCSGFVKQMYGSIGVNLPRTAAEQALVGQPITRLEDLQPGDRLYFYEKKRGRIGHTGIYLGKGYFVHSSMGHHGVATDYLSQRWINILISARR